MKTGSFLLTCAASGALSGAGIALTVSNQLTGPCNWNNQTLTGVPESMQGLVIPKHWDVFCPNQTAYSRELSIETSKWDFLNGLLGREHTNDIRLSAECCDRLPYDFLVVPAGFVIGGLVGLVAGIAKKILCN